MEDIQDSLAESSQIIQISDFELTEAKNLFAKAENLVKFNEFDKAVKLFHIEYENGKKTVDLCRYIGFCYQQLERFDLAKKFYEEAIAIHKLTYISKETREAINSVQVN